MDTERFLQLLLPAGVSLLCATSIVSGRAYNLPCENTHDIARYAATVDANGGDAYFALGGFARREVVTEPGGKPRFRIQSNVTHLRCFWLDVDVGADKDYATPLAAADALEAFLLATGLPRPTVVLSGGGLHLYWPVDRNLTRQEWQTAALSLKTACVRHGFKTDPSRTADSASILRVPGTHNYKFNRKRPVRLIDEQGPYPSGLILGALSQYTPATATPTPAPANTDGGLLFSNFDPAVAHGVEQDTWWLDAPDAAPIIARCQQVRQAGEQSEPVWHAMISVIRLCRDADTHVHQLSCNDPRYDPDDTDRKIAQAARYQGADGMPATCDRFDSLRPGVCAQCRHWQKIKSPILLGRDGALYEPPALPAAQPAPTLPLEPAQAYVTPRDSAALLSGDPLTEYSNGVMRINGKGLQRKHKDENGNETWLPVSAMHIGIDTRLRVFDSSSRYSTVFYHIRMTNAGHESTFLLDAATLCNKQKVVTAFSAQEAAIAIKYQEPFADFMAAYGQASKDHTPEINVYPYLGWTGNGAFSLGGRFCLPDGSLREGVEHPHLARWARACTPMGTLDSWKRAAAHTVLPGHEHAAAVLAVSFASPLMALAGCDGYLMHIWSKDSGTGKTSTCDLALSVWGNPASLRIVRPGSDVSAGATMNAAWDAVAAMRNLPVVFDELHKIKPEVVHGLIHGIAGGTEKMRLNSVADVREARHWSLAALSSANKTMREMLGDELNTDPLDARFLEIPFNLPADQANITQHPIKLALANYGHAGLLYARFLAANRAVVQDKINEAEQRISQRAGFVSRDRFLSRWLACMDVGMELAGFAGIVPFDQTVRARVLEFLLAHVTKNKQEAENVRELQSTLIDEFLNDNMGDIVVVYKEPGGKMYTRSDQRLQRIKARLDTWDGRLYISYPALRKAATARGVSVQAYVDEARRYDRLDRSGKENPEKLRKNLGYLSGDMKLPQTYSFCMRLKADPEYIKNIVERDQQAEDIPDYQTEDFSDYQTDPQ